MLVNFGKPVGFLGLTYSDVPTVLAGTQSSVFEVSLPQKEKLAKSVLVVF